MILSEKLEHGMEYENGQENIEKLRRIGGRHPGMNYILACVFWMSL